MNEMHAKRRVDWRTESAIYSKANDCLNVIDLDKTCFYENNFHFICIVRSEKNNNMTYSFRWTIRIDYFVT